MASSINKWLGKSTGLQAVLEKQKLLQECMVKTNPCRTNVSSSLLKWSMTESNLSIFDAFSSWSDLDHALVLLTQSVIDQNFAFRQTFKNIQGEERRLVQLQKDTEAASKKVKQISLRLDATRKLKKVDQVKIDNLEAELTLAKGKEREMMSIVDAKEKEFEVSKGKWLKETLCMLSKCYIDCLQQSLEVWRVKHQIASAMADDPVYHGENLKTDSHLKVSGMFSQLGMALPTRDESTNMRKRTLPAKPPPDKVTSSAKHQSMVEPTRRTMVECDGYEWKVDGSSGTSDGEEDYAFPDPSPEPDSGENYLVPGFADDAAPHPSPPASPVEDTGDQETSSGSFSQADKTASLSRGIKVLPSGGTMRGTNPILPSTKADPMPAKRTNRRQTPPPSPPSRVDLGEKLPKPAPSGEKDKRNLSRKPAVLPKPTKLNDASKNWSSRESVDNANEDEHEYSDVPIEPGDDCRYPNPSQNGSSKLSQNNNITQVIETDSDDEDYENVAISAIS